MERIIRVCQNTTCRKQGSAKVLKALKESAPADITVEGCGCLGQCGSGPNVLILPENEWCLHVKTQTVDALLRQHLENTNQAGDRAEADSKANKVFRLWLLAIGGMIGAIALTAWFIAKNAYYT